MHSYFINKCNAFQISELQALRDEQLQRISGLKSEVTAFQAKLQHADNTSQKQQKLHQQYQEQLEHKQQQLQQQQQQLEEKEQQLSVTQVRRFTLSKQTTIRISFRHMIETRVTLIGFMQIFVGTTWL